MTARGTNRRLIVNVQQRGNHLPASLIERHVRSVLAQLVSARLLNTLRITVKVRTRLDGKAKGLCGWRDENKGATARSKHYTITIQRDLGWLQLLCTLSHELRHVEQMARGRLAIRTNRGELCWFWRPGAGQAQRFAVGSIAYGAQPWEIEARNSEHLR